MYRNENDKKILDVVNSVRTGNVIVDVMNNLLDNAGMYRGGNKKSYLLSAVWKWCSDFLNWSRGEYMHHNSKHFLWITNFIEYEKGSLTFEHRTWWQLRAVMKWAGVPYDDKSVNDLWGVYLETSDDLNIDYYYYDFIFDAITLFIKSMGGGSNSDYWINEFNTHFKESGAIKAAMEKGE